MRVPLREALPSRRLARPQPLAPQLQLRKIRNDAVGWRKLVNVWVPALPGPPQSGLSLSGLSGKRDDEWVMQIL